MTLIERAEKALRDELGLDWPFTGNDGLRDAVRAVLTAIREPDEAMITEAYDSYAANNGSLRAVWGHMIDAMLAEEGEEAGPWTPVTVKVRPVSP